MPIVVLSKEEKLDLTSWTIVGSVHEGTVSHVAVLAEDVVDARLGGRVPVYEMGPPLTTILPSVGPESEDSTDPSDIPRAEASPCWLHGLHVAAWLEDLSEDEKREMRRWHRRISAFFLETPCPKPAIPQASREAKTAALLESWRFIAHPPIKKKVDSKTGNLKAIWYSCAGFVLDCFESNVVKKLLVSWEDRSFPRVSQDTIRKVWCRRFGLELTTGLKNVLGLSGEEPWPVVMPGYIMNAFKRRSDEIRSEPFGPTEHDTTVN